MAFAAEPFIAWTNTGKRTSLGTANEDDARQIIEAKNHAERQPVLNLQIAKAYLAGTDNGITTRTWQQAMKPLTNTKQDANQERWLRAVQGQGACSIAAAESSLKRKANCC